MQPSAFFHFKKGRREGNSTLSLGLNERTASGIPSGLCKIKLDETIFEF